MWKPLMNVLSSDLTAIAGRGEGITSPQETSTALTQLLPAAGYTEPGSSLTELACFLFCLDSLLQLFVFMNKIIES